MLLSLTSYFNYNHFGNRADISRTNMGINFSEGLRKIVYFKTFYRTVFENGFSIFYSEVMS